jgi:hypothetical protein
MTGFTLIVRFPIIQFDISLSTLDRHVTI